MPRFDRRFACALLLVWLLALPVSAQVARSEDEDEVSATLSLSFTNNGRPLEGNEQGKFYIYEVDKRKHYIDWGHSDRTARVPEGEYDLVIRYENGELQETITRNKVQLEGDQEETIDFRVPVAHLKVDITRGGVPIEPFTGSYSVYRAGQRDKPLVRKRPGTEITLRPGTYDIEVAHRAPDGMKTQWLEGTFVDGSAYQSIELGLSREQLSRATVTLVEDGRPVPPELGVWRVYDSGQRSSPLSEHRSGETAEIEKGVYDIGAFYTREGVTEKRWLVDVDLADDLEREIDVGARLTALRVNISARGRPAAGAWYSVYEVGKRDSPLLSAENGDEVELEPGTYDIGCFLRDGGLRADRWLRRQSIREPATISVGLNHRDATLRVLPKLSRRRGGDGPPRLLIVMDSSSRMRARMEDSGTRLEAALPALADSLSTLPASVEVGLRSLGGRSEGSRECSASTLHVAPGPPDPEALTTSLSRMQPLGAAPVAHALEQAVTDLPAGPENTLILVTAGAEGCGGDLCSVAGRLVRDGIVGRIFVVGFDMDRDQMRRLDCVGEQRLARSGPELTAALRDVIRQAASANNGTYSVFRSDRPSEWVAGGSVGDQIKLAEGTYDIQIRSRGKTHKWRSVRVDGDFEAVAGRRPRRR